MTVVSLAAQRAKKACKGIAENRREVTQDINEFTDGACAVNEAMQVMLENKSSYYRWSLDKEALGLLVAELNRMSKNASKLSKHVVTVPKMPDLM